MNPLNPPSAVGERPGALPCAPTPRASATGRAPRRAAALAALVLAAGLTGCGSLLPATPAPPELYALDGGTGLLRGAPPAPTPLLSPAASTGATRSGTTLVVDTPRAAPGYDSSKLIYVREPHRLEAYAYSQWVDPPAKMLQPLIASAIERSGIFRAVVSSPSSASGDWRLGVELLRLQHEFTSKPSRAHLTLRVHLVNATSRAVVASRDIDVDATAASEDPYGGIVAANRAVAQALDQLTAFVASALPPDGGLTAPAPLAALPQPAGVPAVVPVVASPPVPTAVGAVPRAAAHRSRRRSTH